ncbi:MAG: tyrosine--tRNA ligase [Candidatus Dojkabacteria bacterium]|nr:MAG: tyrosine--tRNA ligase [Candidatus Dojkabacteria bacterium]
MKTIQFSIKPELFELFKNAQFGAVLLSDIVVKDVNHQELLQNLRRNIYSRLANSNKNISETKEYRLWGHVFSLLGLNIKQQLPSHLALYKRFKNNRELPKINTLVDIYNHISLLRQIPLGGHNVEGIDSISIDSTNSSEVYISKGKNELVEANRWAYMDNHNRVLTKDLVWRQSDVSLIGEETKSIFIPIDDITASFSNHQLANIVNEIVDVLSNFYNFKWSYGIINKYNQKILLTTANTEIISKPNNLLLPTPEINTSNSAISSFLDHKIDEVYPSKESLIEALKSGRRLSFYIGADATAPRLHLGHLIPVLKLKELQEMGHRLVFLIGDFTARIGDPTDKSAARVMLTEEEVNRNAKNFLEQIKKYIDFDSSSNPAEVVFNSTWNDQLSMSDVIDLSSNFTVQQMLERDMFAKRIKENKPIYLHEFLYPLLQGYDSVYMGVDGEFGGRDQTFNMLAGRTLAKNIAGIDKFVVTTHFLLSADGVNKMSKSIGNCIFIDDSPQDKYGKVMSIPDELIMHYYQLATQFDNERLILIEDELERGQPMDIKKKLAFEVVRLNDGESSAKEAQNYFEQTVQLGNRPNDAREVSKSELRLITGKDTIQVKELLILTKLCSSNSEAKRLCKSGAVEVNEIKATNPEQEYSLAEIDTIKAGKRNWIILVN